MFMNMKQFRNIPKIPGYGIIVGNCIAYELTRPSTKQKIFDMLQGLGISLALVNFNIVLSFHEDALFR